MLIYDLPLGFLATMIAQQLDNFIGDFVKYDSFATQQGYKRIMRIRV